MITGHSRLESVSTLYVPSTTVKSKRTVFRVKLAQTTWVWRLIWVLVEQVVYTSCQLKAVSNLVGNLCVNQGGSVNIVAVAVLEAAVVITSLHHLPIKCTASH